MTGVGADAQRPAMEPARLESGSIRRNRERLNWKLNKDHFQAPCCADGGKVSAIRSSPSARKKPGTNGREIGRGHALKCRRQRLPGQGFDFEGRYSAIGRRRRSQGEVGAIHHENGHHVADPIVTTKPDADLSLRFGHALRMILPMSAVVISAARASGKRA